jgi:osmotically-inducible protein OsmY
VADKWEERNRSDYDDRNRERYDRGTMNRAGDEVRSWFGDEEAARRRRMDEVRDEQRDREYGGRGGSPERAWERTRDTARDVTDRDRDGRRGLAEWNDNDRPWQPSPGYPAYGYSGGTDWSRTGSMRADRDDYRSSARSFGDTSRYATSDRYGRDWTGASDAAGWQRQDRGYAGRGPRGYRRGDERIREDVCDRLTDDPRVDASDVEVQVANAEVTLSGSVRTREEKRFAEDLIERITGVREVNNNLKVKAADEVIGTARSGANSVLGLTDTPPAAAPPKQK